MKRRIFWLGYICGVLSFLIVGLIAFRVQAATVYTGIPIDTLVLDDGRGIAFFIDEPHQAACWLTRQGGISCIPLKDTSYGQEIPVIPIATHSPTPKAKGTPTP